MTVTRLGALEELIHRLDDAVAVRDDAACCRRVKQVLTEVIGRGERFLDAAFLRPAPDRYARRLVHRDPTGRYSVLAMVWDKGTEVPRADNPGKRGTTTGQVRPRGGVNYYGVRWRDGVRRVTKRRAGRTKVPRDEICPRGRTTGRPEPGQEQP